ncbi:hypothetical protein D3C71_1864870 [compost metagenome]
MDLREPFVFRLLFTGGFACISLLLLTVFFLRSFGPTYLNIFLDQLSNTVFQV